MFWPSLPFVKETLLCRLLTSATSFKPHDLSYKVTSLGGRSPNVVNLICNKKGINKKLKILSETITIYVNKHLTDWKTPHNRIGYHYLVYQFEVGGAIEEKRIILRM